nr:MAG TPA: hypothetical protein [Microviridae sp.]
MSTFLPRTAGSVQHLNKQHFMSTKSACCPYKLIIYKRKLHIPLLEDI